MKRSNVVVLDKDWWKVEREPSAQLVIKTKKQAKLAAKYLTVKEFADRMSVRVWCVYDWIRDGELEAQPIGRRIRLTEEACVDFLSRQSEKKRRG